MLDYRSTLAAAMLAGALFAGCTDPEQRTDLRTSGPPNITAVTVLSDLETASDPDPVGIGRIVETATFCRLGDEKRPGLVGLPDVRVVQLCPDDLSRPADLLGVAEATPPTWFVRVVFDKLLDASIEELVPEFDTTGKPTGDTMGSIKNTHPVTLMCEGNDVPYDGYYVPNGNNASWPPGPALVIQPLDPTSVPTGASCTVAVEDKVHSKKDKTSVPGDQRNFQFKIGPMAFRFSDPDEAEAEAGKIVQDMKTPVDLFWTAALDEGDLVGPEDPKVTLARIDRNRIEIVSGPNLNIGTANTDGDPDPAVCDGSGGTPVDPATIRAYLRGSAPTTTALIMRLDLRGGAAPMATAWAPTTTYRISFAPGTTVSTKQRGPDGAIPDDFTLCFHTPAS
jgi:hypothetical protein